MKTMKKKMFAVFALMFLGGISAFAQNYVILVQPAGSKEWGYSDLKGNMIIEPKYKKCIGFSEDGLAAIYDAKIKKFQFINLKGEVLPTETEDFKLMEVFLFGMKGFNDGLAPVKIGEKWGFMNTQGKIAIEAKYDKVTIMNSGFASAQREGKFFVVDKSGTEFQVDVPGIADVNDFSEKLASFKTAEDLVGFVNGAGEVAIEAKFKAAGDFHGGLAWAKNDAGMLGYINPQGEWVLKPEFEAGKNFDPESGLARIKNGDRWGYSDKAGDVAFMNDSELIEDFFNGLARGKKSDKFGFYNTKMEWAIEPQFDGARDFKNGYAAVRSGELWGVIDKTGKWVIDPKFEDIKDVEVVK
jgi:hypothetical protein